MKSFIFTLLILLVQPLCITANNHGYSKTRMETKLADVTPDADSKKILVILPLPHMSYSHFLQMSILSKGLAEKGHQVDILGNSQAKEFPIVKEFGSTHAFWYEVSDPDKMDRFVEHVTGSAIKDGPGLGGLRMFSQMISAVFEECQELFSMTALMSELKDEKYDLVVTNLFFPCEAFIARFLDVDFVAVTTSRGYPFMSRNIFGFPSEMAYVPELFLGLTDSMSFVQRIQNVFVRFLNRYFLPLVVLRDYKEIQIEHNIDVGSDVQDVMGKALLWISYSDLSLEFPEPTMPNFVRIGGMAVTKAKPLEKELEDFVQGSGEHGLIVFTLGSMIGSFNDPQTTELIAGVFSRLPQRVIWRHTDVKPKNLGNNTMILDWMPQNDLLAHPKTRLFIGHGGSNGVYEALHHAVPMVLMPMVAPDQWDNAARVVSKGMGLQLDSRTLTEEIFYNALIEVLQNHKYKDNVTHYSAIHHDLPPAKENAVYWIEHVMKFGDKHLRAKVFDLNLIQYYLLDVAAFFLFILFVVIFLLRFTCGLCCRACGVVTKKKIE